ncbi:MAG: ribosome biogenesis GTPase Der [Saprospiraceae bacterium]
MTKSIVAIVGRPNVGKSTLFNRIVGKQTAIVHDSPGVTRDRNYGEAEWNGKSFFLIDTGGFVPNSKDKFESAVREQVKISIDEADIVLFVVDALSNVTPLDEDVARILRKEIDKKENEKKKVILVVNKVDNTKTEVLKSNFYRLGLGEPVNVSALIGRSSGDLLDLITNNIESDDSEKSDELIKKFAIIGRPNAGKSSLLNALTQTERHIVTDIPGTTRDSIDTTMKYYGDDIMLIDTAGLRKKNKIKRAENIEYYSTIRTKKSIERCDVAIIVIDAINIVRKLKKASDPNLAVYKLDREDVEIIGEASRLKKGILLVINKWDIIEKDNDTADMIQRKVKEHLKNFDYLPFVFISALTKQRITKVLELAMKVYKERTREIKTSELNAKMRKFIDEFPPRSKSHRELKINYITQLQTAPPVIGFFANNPTEIEENYKRFLENKLRECFSFVGVPLTLAFKKKN